MHRLRSVAPLSLALGATAVGLGLGYLLKVQCVLHPWADNFQYSHLCYNDIQPLFGVRGISRGLVPYRDVQLEYPVLTGMFMDVVGRLLRGLFRVNSDVGYFHLTSVLLAPFAFMTTLLLRRHVSAERLMLWAIGTPLILYSFHNWDLIAVAFATWGLVAFERSTNAKSGLALATGASAKLFPAFLLPGAVLHRIALKDRIGATRLVLVFLGVYVAINVPWVVLSNGVSPLFDNPGWSQIATEVELRAPDTNGWLGVWLFHAKRYPDFGTVWYWIQHHGRVLFPTTWWDPGQTGYRDFVSIASFVMFGLGSALMLLKGWRRRLQEDGYPVVATGLGILAIFLITSKVNSPQFTLWLVPLLVLLNVPWRYALFYFATDLAVYVCGFYWFTVFDSPAPGWKGLFELSVLLRATALGVIVWSSLSAKRNFPDFSSRPGQTEQKLS
ncbi:MAG: hypothetical protein ABIS18_03380 [Actinomycetota bacterium]